MRQEGLDLAQLVAVLPAHPHRRQLKSLDRSNRAAQPTRKLLLGQPWLAIGRRAHQPFPI